MSHASQTLVGNICEVWTEPFPNFHARVHLAMAESGMCTKSLRQPALLYSNLAQHQARRTERSTTYHALARNQHQQAWAL